MRLNGSSPADRDTAARLLAAGELVALPTETVYGLAANAEVASAVAKIFAAKGRPSDHPLIVHVTDWAAAQYFVVDVPPFAHRLAEQFWPGPLTLILPRRDGIAAAAAGGQASVGVRCPAHPVALAVLRACALLGVHGLAAPSANKFGRISPTSAEHVETDFDASLAILDGGPCTIGIESTIVDCTRGSPVLLRPGRITLNQLQSACGLLVLMPDQAQGQTNALAQPAPRASGTLAAHYAPHAPLRLMSAPEMAVALASPSRPVAPLAVYSAVRPKNLAFNDIWQAMPNAADACAQELFAVLRTFDQRQATQIWVQAPPEDADWAGVRDRLSRAAAAWAAR
jgi:L-threonylcarbamoyladenylate synthase